MSDETTITTTETTTPAETGNPAPRGANSDPTGQTGGLQEVREETTIPDSAHSTNTAQSNLLAEAGKNTDTVSAKTKSEGKEEKIEGEGDKGEKKPEPLAPEEYGEFTLPEGVQFDETAMTEFKSFAKEQDLTQEQAQKVLEFGSRQIKERLSAPYKLWGETQTEWQAEVKADPEIGGTKFEQSIKESALVFQPGESNPFVKSAEEAQVLRQALNTTGAGNNPAMVRLFVKMGRLLSEPGTLAGNPVRDKQGDLLTKMYPTMNET